MHDHAWGKQLHWFECGAELLGTAFLVFAGVSAVVFDFGAGLPLAHVLPDLAIRRLITGPLFAGSSALVAISPPGKLSGGHINPAVSLAFWVQGKMHHFDQGGYIFGQVLGAICGRSWWCSSGEDMQPVSGMERTALGVGSPLWIVFLTEVSLTFLLAFSIFFL